MNRYVNYHKHSHYSNIMTLDCIVNPEDYCKRAVELGHTEYVTTEHGFQGNIYEAYTLCEQYGLRCLYGVEAYYVDNRHEKDKGNYHICLIAMTNKGRKDINRILSEANLTGFYYKPRIDRELILSLNPNDVVITTACVASRLFKGDNWFKDFFLPLYGHFGDRFYLEVQNHNHEVQKKHNENILRLHEEYNVKLIHANDSHYIYPEDSSYRKLFLKAKGLDYGDEDNFILDYPDYDTIVDRYKKQGVLTDEQIYEALNNTLIFDKAEPIHLDKEFKIPKITNGDSNKQLRSIINEAWKEESKNIPKEQHKHYIKEIRYEYDMVEKCGMADYFILDHLVVKKAVKEYGAVLTHTGRGSAVSYYINKLLGLTELDRIWCPVKLYPTRFMSDTRILESRSLPDIDLNFADVAPVIKANQDYLDVDGIRQMVSYKPMQNSSAFRLWCKAIGMDIKEYDEVAKDLGEYKKEYEGKYKDDKKWGKIIKDSERFKGVIESISPSPCSYLLLDKPISEEVGLLSIGSGKDKVICCCLDGYNCDYYKYLKNDFLIVTVWDIISKVYKKIEKPIDNIKELLSKCDDKVWQLYADGITSTLNQADSEYDKQILTKYKPNSFEEMCAYVAAIRPGFASQLSTFVNRENYSTGVEELDNILSDSFHYIMYQENVMTYLTWLGIPEKNTYDIIKKISKKKFTEQGLADLKAQLLKGWIKRIGTADGFEKTWEIVELNSKYSFNASHSACVALDSIYGAYLKSHYPLEYYEVVFNIYNDDLSKTTALTNELSYFNITLSPIKFRYSGNKYIADKSTNTIYKGLSSLKYMNDKVTNALYELRNTTFNSFIDFLKVNPCDSRQTIALIKLNFFSEFGKSQQLLNIYNLYDKFGKRKQINKSDCPIEESIMLHYATATEKQYKIFDNIGFMSELCKNVEDKDIPLTEQLKTQAEFLGYLDYVNPNIKNTGYVINVDTKYSPKITLYCLDTGKTIIYKVSKKDYNTRPIIKDSIIKLQSQLRYKTKMINGEWVKSKDETEPWIINYQDITYQYN